MSDLSFVPDLLFGIALVSSIWPGIEPIRAVEKPKKGYWTVATVFWPIRRVYRELWPHQAVLEAAARRCHGLALLVTALVALTPIAEAMNAGWIMAEVAFVSILLGRTSGFWSADRRITRAQQADEAGKAETGVRSPTSHGAD